jgi:hypothetical protein
MAVRGAAMRACDVDVVPVVCELAGLYAAGSHAALDGFALPALRAAWEAARPALPRDVAQQAVCEALSAHLARPLVGATPLWRLEQAAGGGFRVTQAFIATLGHGVWRGSDGGGRVVPEQSSIRILALADAIARGDAGLEVEAESSRALLIASRQARRARRLDDSDVVTMARLNRWGAFWTSRATLTTTTSTSATTTSTSATTTTGTSATTTGTSATTTGSPAPPAAPASPQASSSSSSSPAARDAWAQSKLRGAVDAEDVARLEATLLAEHGELEELWAQIASAEEALRRATHAAQTSSSSSTAAGDGAEAWERVVAQRSALLQQALANLREEEERLGRELQGDAREAWQQYCVRVAELDAFEDQLRQNDLATRARPLERAARAAWRAWEEETRRPARQGAWGSEDRAASRVDDDDDDDVAAAAAEASEPSMVAFLGPSAAEVAVAPISSAPQSRASSPTQQVLSCDVGAVGKVVRARSRRLAHARLVSALGDADRAASGMIALRAVLASGARAAAEAAAGGALAEVRAEMDALEEGSERRSVAQEALESVVRTLRAAAAQLHAESGAMATEAEARWRELERDAALAVRALHEDERAERQRRVDRARREEAERGLDAVVDAKEETRQRLERVRAEADQRAADADAEALALALRQTGTDAAHGAAVGGAAGAMVDELRAALAAANVELREVQEQVEDEARASARVQRLAERLEAAGDVPDAAAGDLGSATAEAVWRLAEEGLPEAHSVVDWVLSDVERWALEEARRDGPFEPGAAEAEAEGQGQGGGERSALAWLTGEEDEAAARRELLPRLGRLSALYRAELVGLMQGPLVPSPALQRTMEDVASGEIFAAEAEARKMQLQLQQQMRGTASAASAPSTLRARLRAAALAAAAAERHAPGAGAASGVRGGLGADALRLADPLDRWALRVAAEDRLQHQHVADDLELRRAALHGPL